MLTTQNAERIFDTGPGSPPHMTDLLLATDNRGKIAELRALLSPDVVIRSLERCPPFAH